MRSPPSRTETGQRALPLLRKEGERIHFAKCVRPKDAERNASQTEVLTLGHEVLVGSAF